MATKSATKKRRACSTPSLTIHLNARLKRQIKVAAAAHKMTMSAYAARVLERALPTLEPIGLASDGIVTSSIIERADALRKQQKQPFPEDSADLIREDREQRYSRL